MFLRNLLLPCMPSKPRSPDQFSRLPDDCILNVFEFLDVIDLEQICPVSRRISKIANYQLSRTPKSEAVHLKIVENKRGHSFRLYCTYNHELTRKRFFKNTSKSVYRLYRVYNNVHYAYCIYNPEKPGRNRIETRTKHKGSDAKYRKLIRAEKHPFIPAHEPVPSLLFKSLEQLLERHCFGGLILENIFIDSDVSQNLECIVHNVRWIKFDSVKIIDESIERIASFILKRKLRTLEVFRPDINTCKIFDENFVMQFVEDNMWASEYSLFVDMGEEELEHCRFFASRAAVDYLARFNTIGVLSLTIETSWLPELLENRLKLQKNGMMLISLTDALFTWHFDTLPNNLEVLLSYDEDSTIKDSASGTLVNFSVTETENNRYLLARFKYI